MTRRRTNANTLRATWSKKEGDVLFGWPDGNQAKADGHMIYGRFSLDFTWPGGQHGQSFLKELKERGYDLTTIRFSIMKDPTHPRWAGDEPGTNAARNK